ncbi:hypothetical protein N9P79_00630 [Crocinitomicaceae bacterium]|nr:hypothetical protein [Crocinitomicaceae bacterium]
MLPPRDPRFHRSILVARSTYCRLNVRMTRKMCPGPYALLISLIRSSVDKMVKLFDSFPLSGWKVKIRLYVRKLFTLQDSF